MSFKSLKNILEETMKSEGFMYHMYRITQALPMYGPILPSSLVLPDFTLVHTNPYTGSVCENGTGTMFCT